MVVAAALLGAIGAGAWWANLGSPSDLRSRAEAAEQAKDWPTALRAWRAINATKAGRSGTWLAEAKAAMALDLAGQAERALVRACEADPANPESWRLRLDILRAEGRAVEAVRVGWSAYGSVAAPARSPILRELTLAYLLLDNAFEDLNDDRTLARLDRWAAADPNDADALVARHRRVAAQPRPGDPDLATWGANVDAIVRRNPGQVAAREALVVALADLGEFDRGRSVLDAWPEAIRDTRYQRLVARWALDADDDPARALTALGQVVAELPPDWRAHAGLARAYRALGRPDDAAREADRVTALRELLDPRTLVPRLASDFARPDDPASRRDLAAVCSLAGLDRLAEAWRREGASL